MIIFRFLHTIQNFNDVGSARQKRMREEGGGKIWKNSSSGENYTMLHNLLVSGLASKNSIFNKKLVLIGLLANYKTLNDFFLVNLFYFYFNTPRNNALLISDGRFRGNAAEIKCMQPVRWKTLKQKKRAAFFNYKFQYWLRLKLKFSLQTCVNSPESRWSSHSTHPTVCCFFFRTFRWMIEILFNNIHLRFNMMTTTKPTRAEIRAMWRGEKNAV